MVNKLFIFWFWCNYAWYLGNWYFKLIGLQTWRNLHRFNRHNLWIYVRGSSLRLLRLFNTRKLNKRMQMDQFIRRCSGIGENGFRHKTMLLSTKQCLEIDWCCSDWCIIKITNCIHDFWLDSKIFTSYKVTVQKKCFSLCSLKYKRQKSLL